jgi:hypothetical protein
MGVGSECLAISLEGKMMGVCGAILYLKNERQILWDFIYTMKITKCRMKLLRKRSRRIKRVCEMLDIKTFLEGSIWLD